MATRSQLAAWTDTGDGSSLTPALTCPNFASHRTREGGMTSVADSLTHNLAAGCWRLVRRTSSTVPPAGAVGTASIGTISSVNSESFLPHAPPRLVVGDGLYSGSSSGAKLTDVGGVMSSDDDAVDMGVDTEEAKAAPIAPPG